MALYTLGTFGRLKPHLSQEWLLTNGLGSFASSTVVGCNTRRYHGLLNAATLPPVGRMMTLNRVGEILIVDGRYEQPHEFSVNQFRYRFHPEGWRYIQRFEFEQDAVARFHYDVDGVRVTKEVLVSWMKNVVGVRYTVEAEPGRQAELQLLPFVSLRDFHALRRSHSVSFAARLSNDDTGAARRLRVDGGDVPIHLQADVGHFVEQAGWWYEHVYAIETDRGQDDAEDLFTPGRYVYALPPEGRGVITLWASVDEPVAHDWDAELSRRRAAVSSAASMRGEPAPSSPAAPEPSEAVRKLALAANDFVVARKTPDGRDGTTVIAGYPWFADWGRDTFIALPGLLLTTRRFALARQVLTVFAQYVSEGMIPNKFDDYSNEPHYNTVDASLWFVHSAYEYLRLSGDRATFDRELLPACRAIVDGHRRGTRFGIRMDERDGLITQGDADTQLTWMDAKCGGVAFTPRQGKPVEINALWYHALVLLGETQLADRAGASFREAFWISPFRGLADVVGMDGGKDKSLRPNQIFAASLPNSPLTREQQAAVVEVVRRELLTPYGLRTLARDEPGYRIRYCGPQMDRDAVYHNGLVWPWLIGAFVEAHLRVNDHSEAAMEQGRKWLRPLVEFLDGGNCIGQIPEILEPEEPYRPIGACAQAWSVAEVLRLAVQLKM